MCVFYMILYPQLFGEPVEEQKRQANLYSALFIAIGVVAGASMFCQVCKIKMHIT